MGVSSFDRINQSFLNSLEWKALLQEVGRWITEANTIKYEFFRQMNYSHIQTNYSLGEAYVATTWHYKFGECNIDLGSGESRYECCMGTMLTEEYLNEVPKCLFGKSGYPTYNCKLDKVLKDWAFFARAKIRSHYAAEIKALEDRLNNLIVQTRNSPEFAQEKQHFYEVQIINEIRDVLMKYHGKVGTPVLQEALEIYVATAILEA